MTIGLTPAVIEIVEQNISALSTASDEAPLNEVLISNMDSTSLYPTSSVMGYVWRLYYDLLPLLSSDDVSAVPAHALTKNFRMFEKLFHQVVHKMQRFNDEFSKQFREGLRGKTLMPFREDLILITERLPSLFNLNAPFSLLSTIKKIELITAKALNKTFSIQSEERKALQQFQREYALTAVEGITQRPMPYAIFDLMLQELYGEEGSETTLSIEARKQLTEWIEAVMGKKDRIGPWLLHLALYNYVELNLTLSPHEILEATFVFEKELIKNGCTILLENEPLHTAWVNNLMPKTLLTKEFDGVRLGERVQMSVLNMINCVAYKRHNNPNQLVIVGKTPLAIGIWRAGFFRNNMKIPAIEVLFQGPESRFLVIEKPQFSLNQISWLTTYEDMDSEIHSRDEDLCNELANVISYLFSQKDIPNELRASNLCFVGYNGDSASLRTWIAFQKCADYNVMIILDLLLTASKRNYVIFKELMHRSEFINHPVIQACQNIVKTHLCDESPSSVKQMAIDQKIIDPKIIQPLTQTIKQLKQYAVALKMKFAKRLKNPNDVEKLQTDIRKVFLQVQHETGAPAVFWKGSKEKIIEKMIEEYCSVPLKSMQRVTSSKRL